MDRVSTFKSSIETAKYIFDTQPVFSTKVIEDIDANFEGTSGYVKTYSYGTGLFSLSCEAKDIEDPAKIVANFMEQDIFDNVTYTGYSGGDGENGQNEYTFTISFDMRKITPETEVAENAEGVE